MGHPWEEQWKAFRDSLPRYSDDDLKAALRVGNWYDRRPLRNWQIEYIYRELQARSRVA